MSATGKVFLVRHGEAAASWGESPDPGLSTLGHQQAQDACRSLMPLVGDLQPVLISSPLLRARETAVPLAQALGLEALVDARFREIPSPVPLAERQPWLRAFMRENWSGQSDDLWAWRSAIVRGVEEQDSQRPTIIFTHFLVINALVAALQERDETLVFWPDNASITVVSRVQGRLRLDERGREMKTVVN